jgi:hypothetical protein
MKRYYAVSDDSVKVLDKLIEDCSIRAYRKTIYGVEIVFNNFEAVRFDAEIDADNEPILEIELVKD